MRLTCDMMQVCDSATSGHLAQLSAQVLSLLLNLEVWSCAVTLSQLWNMVKLIKIKQRTYKNWLPRVHGMRIQMKKLTFTRPWACPCLRHELGRWQQWSGIMPLELQLMEVQMYHWMSRVETCNHPWMDGWIELYTFIYYIVLYNIHTCATISRGVQN